MKFFKTILRRLSIKFPPASRTRKIPVLSKKEKKESIARGRPGDDFHADGSLKSRTYASGKKIFF